MSNPETYSIGETIPVIEEVATISKRTVTTGVTTVEKQVESRDYQVTETLESQQASVERIAMNTVVDAANPPQVRVVDGVTIIPVLEEILVVEKRLVLKEARHIRRHVEPVHSSQEFTLRTETVVLKHREVDSPDPDPAVSPCTTAETPLTQTEK
jgi:stress response protein YsnF